MISSNIVAKFVILKRTRIQKVWSLLNLISKKDDELKTREQDICTN